MPALYGGIIIDLPVGSSKERSGAESLSLAFLDAAGGLRAVTCDNLGLHVAQSLGQKRNSPWWLRLLAGGHREGHGICADRAQAS